MNIHEYQAKQLLAKYDIPIPAGDIALNQVSFLRCH